MQKPNILYHDDAQSTCLKSNTLVCFPEYGVALCFHATKQRLLATGNVMHHLEYYKVTPIKLNFKRRF